MVFNRIKSHQPDGWRTEQRAQTPHPKHHVQFWFPHLEKDVKTEKSSDTFDRMTKGLELFPYKEQESKLGRFSLGKR